MARAAAMIFFLPTMRNKFLDNYKKKGRNNLYPFKQKERKMKC